MRILLTKRFLACVKKLSATDVEAIDAALENLPATFGTPHAHAGQSVRVLRPPVYELRATLALRVVFVRSKDALWVDFVGTHDEVRAFLKNRR
jgi:hypothetical protein